MQLLSQHDQQEREQISELTVAANALKMDVAKNNYNMNYSFDRQTERRMIELIREQKRFNSGKVFTSIIYKKP